MRRLAQDISDWGLNGKKEPESLCELCDADCFSLAEPRSGLDLNLQELTWAMNGQAFASFVWLPRDLPLGGEGLDPERQGQTVDHLADGKICLSRARPGIPEAVQRGRAASARLQTHQAG